MNEIKCTKCQATIHPLAVFPGTICLRCHSTAWDAMNEEQRRASFEDAVALFKGEGR